MENPINNVISYDPYIGLHIDNKWAERAGIDPEEIRQALKKVGLKNTHPDWMKYTKER